MLRTLIFHQEEQNRNNERTKPHPNTSSKQSNGQVWRNINCSSPKTLSPQSFNDKKNLVFDKRDFLFRDIPKKLREQIQLDEVCHYSVTDMRTADGISDIIAKLDGLNEHNVVITDGTACAGGNTISFCKKFKKVQAIELDLNRYAMLMHNLKVLGYTNAKCYQANYLDLVCNLTQDIVFLDPPWGGPAYKEKKEVELFLGNTPLDEICEKLKSRAKYIIIKAPTNLNYNKFKAKISGNLQVFHQFRKMILIVVDYYHPPEEVQQERVTKNFNKYDDKINKETYKNDNTAAKGQTITDTSTYTDVAVAAVNHAAGYCKDYDCGDKAYSHSRAYIAALAVAHDGFTAACTAASAAYLYATADVARASDYDDPCAADAYLRFACDYDYYGANVDNSVNGANGTDGDDGSYRTELDAAVNAPLIDDGDEDF